MSTDINDQSTEGVDSGDVNIQTTTPKAPVTSERPVPTDLDKFIKNPGKVLQIFSCVCLSLRCCKERC